MKTCYDTRFLYSLALSTLLLLPALASADGTGFFLEGGIYYTNLDDRFNVNDDDFEDELKAFFDDSSSGFNLGAGYRFNKWLSVDAGYWDLGEFRSDRLLNGRRLSFDTEAYTLGAMASVPLWILDIYARGGVAWWDLDAAGLDEDGTDPYYGVGVAFNFFGSLDIYAEWIRFDTETDLDTAGIGLRLTF